MNAESLPPGRREPTARRRRPRWRCATHAALPPLHPKSFRARLEIRYARLRAAGAHRHHDRYGLARDLERGIPWLSPRTVRLWSRIVDAWEWHAQLEQDTLRRLRDFLRAHEPEADRWLRKRLGELEGAR